MQELFTVLILTHLIGDFTLQSDKMALDKEQYHLRGKSFYLHILTHFILVLAFTQSLKIAAIVGLSHAIIDILKILLQKPETKKYWFFIDQGLHFLMIVLVSQKSIILFDFAKNNLVEITMALALTSPTSILIKNALKDWTINIKNNEDDSLQNAGKYIGILERLFVFIFVIYNHWEAIGFLLTAKSIFRFGDLTESKERKLTEYILIGTLLSFGIAFLLGLLVLSMRSEIYIK